MGLNDYVKRIGEINEKAGWRQKSIDIKNALKAYGADELIPVFENYLFGTHIALCHSELSEALEGKRKDLMDDHLPHRKMVAAEVADVFIRLFDLCDAFEIEDIETVVEEKLAYNATRADHKPENRAKDGGKKF